MSLENAQKFTVAAVNDPALAKEVSAAVKGKGADKAAAAFAALGKSKGYEFSAAEAAQTRASFLKASPMSDGELEKVAGGVMPAQSWRDHMPPPFIGTWEELCQKPGSVAEGSGAPRGSDPRTWGPGNQPLLGSDPATWTPPHLLARRLFDW